MALNLKATRADPPQKVPPPEFVPTPPHLPLREHVVPQMGKPVQQVQEPVWRMRDAEIDEVMPWLFPKLAERWPRLDADRLVFFLKQAMPSRTMLLCRTRSVVGCFEISQDIFEPMPAMKERFVRQKEPLPKETELLYAFAYRWAVAIKARICWFGLDTNVQVEDMRITAGRLLGAKQRSYFWLDIMEKKAP